MAKATQEGEKVTLEADNGAKYTISINAAVSIIQRHMNPMGG